MSEKMDLHIGDREMLHNRVCSILRRAILKGDFKPGERLVQMELAESIGVSRMPIREALRQLEIEGLVTLEPHKGAVVRSLDLEDIKEIYEIRSVLEPLALKKSMEYFDSGDLETLKSYHQRMLKADNEDEYVELNTNFHKLLSTRCKSPRLLNLIKTISRGFPLDTPQIIHGQIDKSNIEHEKILSAILEQDKVKAAKYLADHISRTGKELLVAMENKDFK